MMYNSQQLTQVSIVITSYQRYDLLMKTINSFYQYNTYPYIKFIVVQDGPQNQAFNRVKQKYPNITWVCTGSRIGQIAATDLAYKYISGQYYVHGQNDFIYTKKGFIQQALIDIKRDARISGVSFMPYLNYQSRTCNILDHVYCGWTFNPSLHRFSHYKAIKGGYVGLTSNMTYGVGAGVAQQAISDYYLRNGYYVYCFLQVFIKHIGDKRGTSKSRLPLYMLRKNKDTLNQRQKQIYEYTLTVFLVNKWQRIAISEARAYFSKGFQMEFNNDTEIKGIKLSNLGADKQIQVASQLNYLSQKLNVNQFYKNFIQNYTKILDYVKYDIRGQKIDINYQKVSDKFKSYQQLQTYLNNNNNTNQSMQYKIAKKLLTQYQTNQTTTTKILDAQQYFYNNKYKFDYIQKQQQLCVVIEGTNFEYYSQQFITLIQSIKKQNYTNYRLLFITRLDPNVIKKIISQYGIAYYANYITILRNVRGVSNLANFYVLKKYCRRDSIIVMLKATDQLLGKNVLKVINSVYQNSNLMYATFRSIQRYINTQTHDIKPQTQNLDKTMILKFRTQNKLQVTSFLKTFRHRFSRVPIIQQTIEIIFNQKNNTWLPKFYDTYSDIFETYALIELAGAQQTQFFDDFLIFRRDSDSRQKCEKQRQQYVQMKAKVKTPLKPLFSLNNLLQQQENYEIPGLILQEYGQKYKLYHDCQTTRKKKQNKQRN